MTSAPSAPGWPERENLGTVTDQRGEAKSPPASTAKGSRREGTEKTVPGWTDARGTGSGKIDSE
jgi:hypothetical protein